MSKKIYIAGSINTDLVIRAPYMPQKGETLRGSGFFTAHGGKGANQAVAAARLGGGVRMCGCVGADLFGEQALSSLRAEGIDVTHIRTAEGVPSGTAVIVVVDGDNRILLDSGANACLCEKDLEDFLAEAEAGDIYLTQLENPVDVIGCGLKLAKEKGMYVILNPAPADRGIEKYLPYCDLVVPNETEYALLNEKGALSSRYGGDLIVTLGDKGFSYLSAGKRVTVPCKKVDVVDTTAAGDTFCGGLAVLCAEGADIVSAAKFGSAAASLACTCKGAQPSVPTRARVLEFMKG